MGVIFHDHLGTRVSVMCPICLLPLDPIDRDAHMRLNHGGAVDREHFEAMIEVDDLTPATPPLVRDRRSMARYVEE